MDHIKTLSTNVPKYFVLIKDCRVLHSISTLGVELIYINVRGIHIATKC